MPVKPGERIAHLRRFSRAFERAREHREQKLHAAQKRFVERKPQTRYALTERGRQALLDYVTHLETLLPGTKPKSRGK